MTTFGKDFSAIRIDKIATGKEVIDIVDMQKLAVEVQELRQYKYDARDPLETGGRSPLRDLKFVEVDGGTPLDVGTRKGPPTPADFLEEIANIYRERKPLYGDNYKHVGRLMRGMYPDGLHIAPEDEEAWNRLHLIFHMVSKLTRYAQNLQRGGHQDSLDDLAVYAMLARECDAEAKEKKS